MKKAYYEQPARARKDTKCYKCVWRHAGGDYLCDFATLAAPLTRSGVPPEECRHFVEGRRVQTQKDVEKALKILGLG